MAEKIVNRVAQSKLVTFDLEELYPNGDRIIFDIRDWLHKELILKEKDFRIKASKHNWSQYQGKYMALMCSSDAIVPAWAYMFLATKLKPYSKKVIIGDLENLETSIYQDAIQNLDVSPFRGKPVIIKGCSNKPVPRNAYLFAIEKIQGVAKSIMYGEACSSVPLYKQK